jgi:hypothetical protein
MTIAGDWRALYDRPCAVIDRAYSSEVLIEYAR